MLLNSKMWETEACINIMSNTTEIQELSVCKEDR